jgi:hypothetical protein
MVIKDARACGKLERFMLFKSIEGTILKAIQTGALVILAVVLAGCGTVPNAYIPATVGSLGEPDPASSMKVIISSKNTLTFIGDPIIFQVTLKNVSEEPVWVPREPDVLLTWIYPNGRHDNFLREFQEERYYSSDDAVQLLPGQQITKFIPVKTYFFERAGITEFRALVHASRNTNSRLEPFWEGKALSNAFGVLVESAKKKGLISDASDSVKTRPPPS